MSTIDYKKLKGKALWSYFINDHPDKDYQKVVRLLPNVLVGTEKEKMKEAYSILEECVRDDLELFALYEEDETYRGNLRRVGGLDDEDYDSALYIRRQWNKIDYKKLKGKALWDYFTQGHPDDDYRSVVGLLPYAMMECDESEKVYSLLERCVRDDLELFASYPMFDETDVSEMEWVGGIMDGGLYLKKSA